MKLLMTQHPATVRSALSVGLGRDDIEQLAWTGVMRAAFKYDPTKPNPANPGQPIKFKTYASVWIFQMVSRARDAARKALLATESGKAWQADAGLKNDPGANGWDLLPAPSSADDGPDERDRRDVLRSRVAKVLRQLPERYRLVMEVRYGLSGGEPLTLQDAGAVLGVTRERVRQIEAKCLQRIRVPLQLACGDLLA